MRAAPLAVVLGLLSWCFTALEAGIRPPAVPVATSRGEFVLLVHPPSSADTRPREGAALPLVLLVSGEGGWRAFDARLARWLSEAGYWVGGLDAMKYFWKAQDDRRSLAADFLAYGDALARAAGRGAAEPILLVGFSFGADLAPWAAGMGAWKGRARGLVLIGPDQTGSLEFRISEMLGLEQKDHVFSVASALAGTAGIPTLFIHGAGDPHSDAPALLARAGEPKKLISVPDADHHFSGHEEGLHQALLDGLRWVLGAAQPTRTRP